MSYNKSKVIDRIKVSADKGDADSQFILATMCDWMVEYRDYDEALKYYLLSAENGIAEAQYRLGDIYSSNSLFPNVDKNEEEGVKYYKLAADNGHAQAQYIIAQMYEHGMNRYDYSTGKTVTIVPKNEDEALKYYELAAVNGISNAQIRILEIMIDKKQFQYFDKYYDLASNNEDEHTRLAAANLLQIGMEKNKKIKRLFELK